MKKFLMCVLAIVLGLSLFACGPQTEKDVLKVFIPEGAPALAIAGLMKDDTKINDIEFNYTVVNSSTIATYVTSKSADFAIVPTNLAANVFNKGIGYKLAATVTHGNLYIVGNQSVDGETVLDQLSALKDKKLGIIGQSAVPDLFFRYILNYYDIDYNIYNSQSSLNENEISITYYPDGAGAMQGLKTSMVDYALLGEPAVSNALKVIDDCEIALDLCDIWEDISGDRLYPQACIIVKDTIDRVVVEKLIEKMIELEGFSEEKPQEALAAMSGHMLEGTNTTISSLDADTVKRSNIKIIKSSDCKTAVNEYIEALRSIDSDAVGGKALTDEFYF